MKICQQKIQGLFLRELPTVVCIEWVQPLMTAANWIPELVQLAGGQNLLSVAGKSSSHLQWETLLETNPDVIIFMPCGFDLNRTRQEAQLLTQRREWEKLHAAQIGRVYITDANAYFNRPELD